MQSAAVSVKAGARSVTRGIPSRTRSLLDDGPLENDRLTSGLPTTHEGIT